ncbi:hypothetical protein CAS74_000685 [Pichia kudriavzevii]|uniref:Mannosyltransferase n=1 Tax=Pichia kudriavzevii TaxID=4909 RepID=A0A1Z8JUM0_PICKU|nr:uncharacterized protein C5L36_0C06670 [Pichia kudriavzevii]AWU76746.1 hypothetical protein C5L36_0C06670 [Pichia kudriavzevii]OUT24298.1 hypothetical protein CAS74_000685 [Pichia kudriavzevii]
MLRYVLYAALLATRLHGAIYAIIPDCDETYNYWEPLNFLVRHFGKQTWEYSPEYAIRSYAYLVPYSLVSNPISWIKQLSQYFDFHISDFPPYTVFYAVRLVLAILFTLSEIKLSKTLKFLNKRIGNWFLLAQILSPGMYQASISILPSSFALLFGILSTNYIVCYFNIQKFICSIDEELINLENKVTVSKDSDSEVEDLAPRTNMLLNLYKVSTPLIYKSFTLTVLFTAIGGFAGWPFSMVLIVPFVIYALINAITYSPKSVLKNNYSASKALSTYFFAGVSCLFFIPYFISQFDSLFYRKATYVAWNILSYNVFQRDELTGPEIFGTESVGYYLKNLLLNYHVLFVIATANFLTLFNRYQLIIYKLPLLIWFAIFFSQPHKEERFIYPVYHLISISFAQFMSCDTFKINCFMKFIKKILNLVVISSTIFLFLTRVTHLNTNYSAPISTFKYLSKVSNTNSPLLENVCIGREWYQFPSSFFLNDNQRLKFTQSNFDGMLPGDFSEPKSNTFEAIFNATSELKPGFNNMNKYNPVFVVRDLDKCTYYVDTNKEISSSDATSLEYWDIMYCEKFIDVDNSKGLERILNVSSFLDRFIIQPWLYLQSDLSTIELNRKLMQMAGIIADGRTMYDNIYAKLGKLRDLLNVNFGEYIGSLETNEFCVARKI